MLTVLVAEAFFGFNPEGLSSDDDVLRAVLEAIVLRLSESSFVENPVSTSENLARLSGEEMRELISRLAKFLDVAERATVHETEFGAADTWQEEFGHLFPMPEVEESLHKSNRQLPVPIATPEVKVTAQSRDNASGRFSGANRIGPIPRNCAIEFEVTNPFAMPPGSKIVWTVRNEGREAENTNDLGHPAGVGLRAHENSKYQGTHYMDCAVTGLTLAVRRIPVVITGSAMPRRYPKKRPEWTNLRGRR